MSKQENILVIGDLHEPFCLDGYRDFCQSVAKEFKTTRTIFIGDIIDNHYSSYHETDPDGYSAGEELRRATDRLKKWHKAFPNAQVCIGNHDRMAARKVFSAGLSAAWLRNLNEVLQVPTWNFQVAFIHNKVRYVHGDKGQTARTKAQRASQSTVQGHRHTEGYVWWNPGSNAFGMQVGCGIDDNSYAMAYAQEVPIIRGCGVVLDNGRLPIFIPMP